MLSPRMLTLLVVFEGNQRNVFGCVFYIVSLHNVFPFEYVKQVVCAQWSLRNMVQGLSHRWIISVITHSLESVNRCSLFADLSRSETGSPDPVAVSFRHVGATVTPRIEMIP